MSTRRPGLRVVLTDLASFIGGWALILHQAGLLAWLGPTFAPPSQPSEMLILVGALCVGVPGAQQLISMRTGGGSSTAPQSSVSASAESPPSSSGGSSKIGD